MKKTSYKILPFLLSLGLEISEAVAISHNCAKFFFMLGKDKPKNIKQILDLYSLDEIASLLEFDEFSCNENFEKAVKLQNEPN